MKIAALAMMAAVLLTGCATYDTQRFDLSGREIVIVCRDLDDILAANRHAEGFTLAYNEEIGKLTTITIPWTMFKDINGKRLPDFHLLGHELWHCSELGGTFHD